MWDKVHQAVERHRKVADVHVKAELTYMVDGESRTMTGEEFDKLCADMVRNGKKAPHFVGFLPERKEDSL